MQSHDLRQYIQKWIFHFLSESQIRIQIKTNMKRTNFIITFPQLSRDEEWRDIDIDKRILTWRWLVPNELMGLY